MSVSCAGSGSLGFSSVFTAAVFAEEVDVGDEESGDITTVDVQALLEAFFFFFIIIIIVVVVIIIIIIILEIITKIIMYMFLRSACYIDEVFIG
jgi:hypothetical protein